MITTFYPIFRLVQPLINSVFREYWYLRLKTNETVLNNVTSDVFYKLSQNVKMSPSKVIFGDKAYIAVDKSAFKAFVKQDDTPDLKYIADRRDCNAFVDVFKGHVRELGNFLVGDCWGYCDWVDGYHAFIIFYSEQKWYALEPQNRNIYPIESVKEITFLKF